jgi:hypothetical protein
LTTKGNNVGAQVSVPISPILNATVSTGKNQFTVEIFAKGGVGEGIETGINIKN